MATDLHTNEQQSVTELVKGVIEDAQDLLKQQVAMLRHEIRADFQRTRQALLFLAAGVGVCALGALLLSFTLVHGLAQAVPELPLWASYAIVGGVLAAAGGAFLFAGIKRFQSFNPLPDESAEALKETLQWRTNRR